MLSVNGLSLEIATVVELIDRARAAREHSYAPYSHFNVGAAILAGNTKGERMIVGGCNVVSSNFINWNLYAETSASSRIGVNFTASGSNRFQYCAFLLWNFRGYTSGNEFQNTASAGTGTVGAHNISDAGTVTDFGTVEGHTLGGGTAAPSDEPYVVYAPASTALTAARQYVYVGSGVPAVSALEGATFFSTDNNDPYINIDGATDWRQPVRFRVYTSLGESPASGVSF